MLKHWDTHAEYQHFISEAVTLLNPSQLKRLNSMSDSWNKLTSMNLCKCQYKNVVFLSYKHVGKPTCLYDIFSYPQSYIASDPLVGTKVHLY